MSACKSPQWENSMPSMHKGFIPFILMHTTRLCTHTHAHTNMLTNIIETILRAKVYAQLPLNSLLEILTAHPHPTLVKQMPRPSSQSFSQTPNKVWIPTLFYWLLFVNLIPTTVIWEKGPSNEKLPALHWPVALSMGHFLEKWLTWKSPAYYGQCHQSIPSWVVQKES